MKKIWSTKFIVILVVTYNNSIEHQKPPIIILLFKISNKVGWWADFVVLTGKFYNSRTRKKKGNVMRTSAEIREELISQVYSGHSFVEIVKNANVLKNYGTISYEDYKKVKRVVTNTIEDQEFAATGKEV